MPTERLSMRRIRDLLRLKYAQGLSDRAAALSLGLSKGTVGNYLARFSQAGLRWLFRWRSVGYLPGCGIIGSSHWPS